MEAASVLVCEDEPLFALDLKSRLEQFGYAVVGIAASADEAIEMARMHAPDLALMDVRLEGEVPGTEVAAVLADTFGIPSIIITAFADEETLTEAKQAGPLGYLVKPVNDADLRTTIEVGLSRFKQQREARKELEERIQMLQAGQSKEGVSAEDLEEVDQFLRTQKRQALVDISAGVAHHFNNSLTGIIGALEWLSQCKTIPEFESRFVRVALAGCAEARELVQDLMWASGQGLVFHEFCSIKETIEEVIHDIAKRGQSKPSVYINMPPQNLTALCNREALKRGLQALILNGCQAVGQSGEVVVMLGTERLNAPEEKNPNARPGEFIVVRIRDTGAGMEEGVRSRATEPFFTTSDNPARYGMGLAVARGVSEACGGWLDLESEPGTGTITKLYLPLCTKGKKVERVVRRANKTTLALAPRAGSADGGL